jgi:V-type H+-transporting ATPase subunit a
MCRCQIFLQTESAYNCVSELGELGTVMFRDLNPNVNAFQRKFVNEVRRCDEMERKLRYLRREIEKEHVPILQSTDIPDAPLPREMIDLEATFEKLESELREVTTNQETLKENYLELNELKHVVLKVQTFFQDHEDRLAIHALHNEPPQGQINPAVELLDGDHVQLHGLERKDKFELTYITGVIRRDRVFGFERMLWRVSRGNAFLRILEIAEPFEDPKTGDFIQKCVFLIFLQGEQLKSRVKKICEGFRATLFHCPEMAQERREILLGVATRLEDLKTVLSQTQEHRRRLLIAASKNMNTWVTKVWKIKAIYHTLNLFSLDVIQKCLIAECWIPVDRLEHVRMALKQGTEASGSSVACILNRLESDEPPPTYFRLNKFTRGFQNLVDAYGTATYRELNPGPYTIITFPFLFAVMFGDLGHGLIMFMFALWMVLREKGLQKQTEGNEIFRLFFGGRYIMLLMGLFSMYTGIVYNEFFSKSFNIFGSSWQVSYSEDELNGTVEAMLDPKNSSMFLGYPYAYGMDPIWNVAENKLVFLNSFKMKMSVLLGVIQMFFGIILSLLNYTYRKSKLEVFGVFIPQLLFLTSIFVYLCVMIIVKWTYFGAEPKMTPVGEYPGTNCAPQLLIGLINMFMMSSAGMGWHNGTTSSECSLVYFYPGQDKLQLVLVILAVVCIPWMLLTKPIGMNILNKRKLRAEAVRRHVSVGGGQTNRAYEQFSDHGDSGHSSPEQQQSVEQPKPTSSNDAGAGGGGGGGHGHGGPFSLSDAFIYSGIHTIEFCLGCISHTASYLRLWALSLAHSQLSEVLWQKIMSGIGFQMVPGWGGLILVYIFWWIFLALTIAILVMMEGLSAFLHALRLHWVEFNSKFFEGAGEPFLPFSFDEILSEARSGES